MSLTKCYSIALSTKVNDPTEVIVTREGEWLLLTARLDSAAGGANKLNVGGGGAGMPVDPGEVVSNILIGPTTRVQVTSNSNTVADWAFIITAVPIGDVVEALMKAVC